MGALGDMSGIPAQAVLSGSVLSEGCLGQWGGLERSCGAGALSLSGCPDLPSQKDFLPSDAMLKGKARNVEPSRKSGKQFWLGLGGMWALAPNWFAAFDFTIFVMKAKSLG